MSGLKIVDDTHGTQWRCRQRGLLELLDLTAQVTHAHTNTTVHLHLEAEQRAETGAANVAESNAASLSSCYQAACCCAADLLCNFLHLLALIRK